MRTILQKRRLVKVVGAVLDIGALELPHRPLTWKRESWHVLQPYGVPELLKALWQNSLSFSTYLHAHFSVRCFKGC